MELYEVIKNRRFVRNFKDIPIHDDVIQEMLEVARLVPTAGNGQGNVIGVVRDQTIKTPLGRSCG